MQESSSLADSDSREEVEEVESIDPLHLLVCGRWEGRLRNTT